MSNKSIYRGHILDVNLELHRLPDGRDAEFEIIRHPGGAAVLPVTDDGRLMLIRQFRPAGGGSVIEIPAGRLEPEEAPIDCARRELAEEVGFEADEIIPLGAVLSSVGFCDERIHLFIARKLREVPVCRDADEFIAPFLLDLNRALQLLDEGRIVDAKTQLALLRYAAMTRGRDG